MDEKETAIHLAHSFLDDPTLDPDTDVSVLSRQFLRALESKWQPIETAPKDGGVKIGFADGVSFHMLWCSPERFRHQLPMCPQTETGGWVVFAYGLLCYTGSGALFIVKPTHWRPLLDPPC